jgi:hypothetical protein
MRFSRIGVVVWVFSPRLACTLGFMPIWCKVGLLFHHFQGAYIAAILNGH